MVSVRAGGKWPQTVKRPRIIKNAQGMNKTEEKYAAMLRVLMLRGDIEAFIFEPFGLRLADKTFYHPDFLVIYADRIEVHEVKGQWRDDARAKIKIAAERFPWFVFRAVRWVNNSLGWQFEDFGPKAPDSPDNGREKKRVGL